MLPPASCSWCCRASSSASGWRCCSTPRWKPTATPPGLRADIGDGCPVRGRERRDRDRPHRPGVEPRHSPRTGTLVQPVVVGVVVGALLPVLPRPGHAVHDCSSWRPPSTSSSRWASRATSPPVRVPDQRRRQHWPSTRRWPSLELRCCRSAAHWAGGRWGQRWDRARCSRRCSSRPAVDLTTRTVFRSSAVVATPTT